ncbi:MAG: DUF2933 domain-containing protein [Gammaproteobacteria bacterium]
MSEIPDRKRGSWRSPAVLTLCVFLFIAGLFLWLEHRAHLLGALPLLLPLVICIGMHFFLHRGHGGHGGHQTHREEGERDDR